MQSLHCYFSFLFQHIYRTEIDQLRHASIYTSTFKLNFTPLTKLSKVQSVTQGVLSTVHLYISLTGTHGALNISITI